MRSWAPMGCPIGPPARPPSEGGGTALRSKAFARTSSRAELARYRQARHHAGRSPSARRGDHPWQVHAAAAISKTIEIPPHLSLPPFREPLLSISPATVLK